MKGGQRHTILELLGDLSPQCADFLWQFPVFQIPVPSISSLFWVNFADSANKNLVKNCANFCVPIDAEQR